VFSFICCIYGLFFSALSGSDYIAYNCRVVNRWWKWKDVGVIMACFKVLFCQSPGFLEEDRNFQSGRFCFQAKIGTGHLSDTRHKC